MKKIECLLDAIGKLNGIHDPESEAYKLRNPLLIRSYAKPGKHEIDLKGRRIFSSYLNGYKACLFDISVKIAGKSRANVTANGILTDLLACYEIKSSIAVDGVLSFLRRALGDINIYRDTPLSYFVDSEPIPEVS